MYFCLFKVECGVFLSYIFRAMQVSISTQSFTWPVPELAKVSRFCQERLGWTEAEVLQFNASTFDSSYDAIM